MSVIELSDLQFSTKEDPFWASVSFDQLEDEEFILEQYHKLQKNAEVGSNEEHEARLKDIFESDSDALLAEMGLKKDLALPLEVISSGIKPTIFDVQIKRRTKIVERVCLALSRAHESSSIKPKIVEFLRRENTISLQKLISGKINSEAIKAFLTHVDTNGIFSLLHHKQQPLNRLQEKFIELVDNKQEPKDRYSRMQAITGLIALAVSRASLKDMIASIKSILVEQNRAEEEMQSSSISPSVVAMQYLTKLVKYRKYKELSAMTAEGETWNIEVRPGIVLGMCSDGKYLFVAYKDASSISIVKYGTGFYGTERTATLRSRTVSSNSRVWLAVVGKKLYLMIQNNASLITIIDTKDMREDASVNLNQVKKDQAQIVLKRSTSGLNNNNQMQVDSPSTVDASTNAAQSSVPPPPPPPPPQITTPAVPVQPQPTITCSPFTSDGRFLYQLTLQLEAELERVQTSDSQESKSSTASKTEGNKLVCLDVYDPYKDMSLITRVALSPPGNPVRQTERVCEGCGRVNMDLRAYQCKSCYNYVLCSACYTSGHGSKTHNASHIMDPIKESLSVDTTPQKLPFSNDALTRGSLYVTGHQLAIVIPPKVLPNNLKDRYLCRLFNIEDGSFIADVQTGVSELAGVFTCYDTANDMIWSLATSNNIHRMTNWHNVGLGNQHFSPLQPISQITLESISAEALLSQADYALSNSFDEKAQVSLERTCYILLYHMDLFACRLSEKNAALKVSQTKSAEYAVSMREHFSLQASKEVFVQLNALVALCIELYKTKTTPLFKYALLVTLRTLRLNIEHVLMSKIELAEFGLGKEGSLARNIKDRLLELLAIPLTSEFDQTVWQQVQAESAQLLLTGLNMFYGTHEDKALLLLSLLRGEFKSSTRAELLDTLLTVLITHEDTFSVLNYKRGGSEVFKQLLEYTVHDTQQQLGELEEIVQDKEHTHRLFSFKSKSTRVNSLLFYYQNLLIGRAMNDKRHEPLVLQYLQEMLRCSGELLTRVTDIYQRAAQHVSEESVEYSQYTDLVYHLAFKHSLLGSLVPNGLLGLRALQLRGILTVTDETTHALFNPCAQLAAQLDKFNGQVPRVLLEERNTLYKRHTLNLYKAKYVESTHPYLEYANKEVVVNIPKSIHMKVEFDDKCSTENQFDYLQLCVRRPDNPNVLEPISEQFWGNGTQSNWPKGYLTVPGHTVIFLFHTEGGWTTNMMRNMVSEEQSDALVSRRYGFRCKVKGLVKTKPFYIINSLYLHKTLAWFVTVNSADMMRAPYLTASEQSLTYLIDESALFENIDIHEMMDSEHRAFLTDLIALQGTARTLHETLLAALRGQLLPLSAECQAVVDPALRSVLAVLLKYSGPALLSSAVRVSQQLAQNTAAEAPALNTLKALWRYIYVQQLRPWLTTSAQSMKKRADKSGTATTILAAYTHLSAQLTALAEVLLHVTAPSSVAQEQLWSEVLRVCKQLPAAATLTALVHKRQHAAQLRARALCEVQSLFAHTSLISVKQDVLTSFTPVFKQLGGHYAAGLKGCGDQRMHVLRESFEQLFTPLLHILNESSNNYYRLLVLDLFVQHYRGSEDMALLHSSHFFEHLLRACERSSVSAGTEELQLKNKILSLNAAQLPNSFTSKYDKVCQQLIGSTTDLESTLKGQSVQYQLSEQYSPEYAFIMWLYPHSYAEVQNSAGNNRCVVYQPTNESAGAITVQLNSSFYVTFTAATATGVKTLKSVQPLTLAEWNHVVCVCMPHRLVLYINGVLDNELLLADADTPVFTAQPLTLNTMPTGTHSDADPALACHAAQAHLVLSALYDEDADLLARQPPLPPDVAQKERDDAKKFRATARALLWSLGTQHNAPAAAQSALATLLRRRLEAPLRPSKLRVLAAMLRGYAETVRSDTTGLTDLVALTAQLMSRPLPPRLYRTALSLAARILTSPQYDHSAVQSPFITPIALLNRLGVALRITMAIGPRLAAQSPLSFETPTTQAVLVLHYWAGLEPENFATLLQKHATKIYPSKPGVYSPLSRLGEVARETQELGKSVLRMGTVDECWSLAAYLSRYGFTLSIELHPSNPSLQAQLTTKERMVSATKSEVISKLDQFCRPGLGADSMYGHAGALVHLVRGMMRASATQTVIREFLTSAVGLIPRLVQLDEIKLDDAMTQSIVDGVLSSLAIIGGWNELHLRPGALVDVQLEGGGKRRAQLVRYQRIGNQAAVVFMNDDRHVITIVDTSQLEPVPLEPFECSSCPLDETSMAALCHLLLPLDQLPLAKKHPLLTLQLKSMALRALHTLLEYAPNYQLYCTALAQDTVPSVLELARHSAVVGDSATQVLQQNKLIMLRLHEINHASEGTHVVEQAPAPRAIVPHQPYLTADLLRVPTGFAAARNTHHVVMLDNMHRRVAFFGNEKDGAMIPVNAPIPENMREFYFEISFKQITPPPEQPATDQVTSAERLDALLTGASSQTTPDLALGVCGTFGHLSWANPHCYAYHSNGTKSHMPVSDKAGNNNEEEDKRYICPYCLAEGFTEHELVMHVPLRHPNAAKSVVCPICASSPFGDPTQLSADFPNHLLERHRGGAQNIKHYNPSAFEPYATSFAPNDVVGCGYNREESTVYFTLNGKYMGAAFVNVSEVMLPFIAIKSPHVLITLNLGHEPFLFKVADEQDRAARKQVDEERVQELLRAEKERVALKKAEALAKVAARRELAMTLSGFVGFPIPFCMKALEEQEDNIERAADWTLLNMEQYQLNHPELFVDDVSYEEMMSASEDEAMAEAMQESSELSVTTSVQLQKSNDSPLSESALIARNNTNSASKPAITGWRCYIPQHAWQSDQYSEEMLRVDRAQERFWSDKTRPTLVTIDEVHIGCYYKVAEVSEAYRESLPLWLKTMDRTMGKIGVARNLDKQRLLVRLKFYNEDDMTTSSYWYPVSILDPVHNWRQDNHPSHYSVQHIEAIDDVVLLEEIAVKSEREVTAVLLRQLAAQLVHRSTDLRALLPPQVDALSALLPLLNDWPVAPLNTTVSPALAQLTRAIVSCVTTPQSLAQLFTVACKKLASGAQFSLQESVTLESDHPFNYQKCALSAEPAHTIHVSGAHQLYIHFDARTKLSQYDVLSFFSDPQSTHLIARYNQRVGTGRQITYSSFTPLVVDHPRCWVQYTREFGTRPPFVQQRASVWGWKMTCIPSHIDLHTAFTLLHTVTSAQHLAQWGGVTQCAAVLTQLFETLLKFVLEAHVPQPFLVQAIRLLNHVLNLLAPHREIVKQLYENEVVKVYATQVEEMLQTYLQDLPHNNQQEALVTCSLLVQNLFELCALMTHVQRSLQDKLSDKMDTSEDEEDNKRPRKRSKSNAVEWWKWAFDRCVESVDLMDYFIDRTLPLPSTALYNVWLDSQSFNFTMTAQEMDNRKLFLDNGEITDQFEEILKAIFTQFDADRDEMWSEHEFETFVLRTADASNSPKKSEEKTPMSYLNFKKFVGREYSTNKALTWRRLVKLGYLGCLHKHNTRFEDFEDTVRVQQKWTAKMDHVLVHYLDDMHDKGRDWKSQLCGCKELMALCGNDPTGFTTLIVRVTLLEKLNQMVSAFLPFIDLSAHGEASSLAQRVCALRNMLLQHHKMQFFDKILSKTVCPSRDPSTFGAALLTENIYPTVYIDRLDVAKYDKPPAVKVDDESEESVTRVILTGQELVKQWSDEALFNINFMNFITCNHSTIFLQTMTQLNNAPPLLMRQAERCFKVVFKRESAEGEVGPYRESLSQLSQELQSDKLPLLIRSPNMRLAEDQIGVGESRDKWIPNPAATSPACLAMFRFFGVLLAIAIRSKNPLPIDMPTLFWKLMVDEPLEPRDLIEIDYCEYESLLKLKELDQVTFENSIFESFTCVLSDGSTVELSPNGAQTPVTWDNRAQFIQLKCERRLYESKVQIDAIKQGLCTLIPSSALRAVAFYDFRLRACGSPFVDLDLLKRHTRYRGGVKESDPHIRFFWAVLESFSEEERRQFLRFAWGRERLPQEKDFLEDMKIFPNLRPNPDNQLPHAETCFFNVSLPKYTSEEVLRARLLMAITSTQAMDGETHLAGQQHD